MNEAILEIRDLRTSFRTEEGLARAVDRVGFSVSRGRTLGLVGESGCGKSVTALSILRLVSCPPGRYEGGEILFRSSEGSPPENLLTVPEPRLRRIRGREIAMIFQEPMTSLNPVFTIGDQIREAILTHRDVTEAEATARTLEMLEKVGIPAARDRLEDYPHQFSGGMRQRVMIAMALALDPYLLIADEPTTALDVTIQAQILDLMNRLKKEFHMAILLITHDLGVVAEMCDEVVVMYAGQVVESASVRALFRSPAHPYTRGLLGSVHRLGGEKQARLEVIPGLVPRATDWPTGCRFFDRCRERLPLCRETPPELKTHGDRLCRCHLLENPPERPT